MNFQQQSYAGYPGQANPQLIQQQHQFRPQGYPQPGLMTPSNLSAMMAQGYAQQQQMLQQQQSHPSGGAMATPMRPPMGGMPMGGMGELPQGMTPQMMIAAQRQMQLQQMNQSPSGSSKKKKHRPANAQVARSHPSRPQDAYLKGAMGMGGEMEPWADPLDELDSRELAMGRFRARQEILTEIFGPERIKDIPLTRVDAWEGLGMDGETLEAKVLALEKENADLESTGHESIDTWRQNLHATEPPVPA